MKLSRTVQLLLGLALCAAGMYLFLRGADLPTLGRQLAAVSPWCMAGGAALAVASLWLRSVRWRLMLPATAGSNTQGLFATLCIAFLMNNILPARAGEAVRVLLVWRRNHYPLAMAAGSVVQERLIDLVVLFSFFALPVALGVAPRGLAPYALAMAGVAAAALLFGACYSLFPAAVVRAAQAATSLLPLRWRARAGSMAAQAFSTLDWLRSPWRALAMLVLSYLTVGSFVLIVLLVAPKGFGLPASAFALAFAAFGAAIPFSPGYVGTMHATMLAGLSLLGMDSDAGRALAIVYHALTYVPTTLVGLFYFFRDDLKFGELVGAPERLSREQAQP